jgi:hypothetical protein
VWAKDGYSKADKSLPTHSYQEAQQNFFVTWQFSINIINNLLKG